MPAVGGYLYAQRIYFRTSGADAARHDCGYIIALSRSLAPGDADFFQVLPVDFCRVEAVALLELVEVGLRNSKHFSPLVALSLIHIDVYKRQVFDIDLGDFYHTYMELKAKTKDRTGFLSTLKDRLLMRMREQD